MRTAALGTTGMTLTRVGFGAWAVGGPGYAFGWGPQDDDDSVAAIRSAVDSGVNWVDTAAVYGLGHSEEVVRTALEAYSPADRPFVFTKCGLVWEEGDRDAPPRRVGAPDSIRTECEASLRRLGVERIDLLQVHWPPQDGTAIEDTWATLLDLEREGKIRAAGVSNFDTRQLDVCEALGHVDSLQPPFSAIARAAAGNVIPWCLHHETGVVVYSPMHSGLLTGSWSTGRTAALPDDDWRKSSPDFTGDTLQRNLSLVQGFRTIAARHGVSVAAAAVAWTLAFEGVTAAIVGARSAQQVQGWLPGADLVLTRHDLDELAAVMTETGAGSGPKTPTGPTEAPGAGGHGVPQETLDAETAVSHANRKGPKVLDPYTGR